MDAILNREVVSQDVQPLASTNKKEVVKQQRASFEFLSGVFYIFKKVFLLG